MKIKDLYITHRMLFRLIITIVLIIGVPILIIGWRIIDESRTNIDKQTQQIELNKATNFMSYFNSQKVEMIKVAVKIGHEQKISTDYIEHHPHNELDVIDIISNYKMGVPIANKMFVYFKNKVYIIGSNEKYLKNIFIDAYTDSSLNAKVLRKAMDDLEGGQEIYISSLEADFNECNFPGMLICIPSSTVERNDTVIIYYLDYYSLNSAFLGSVNSDNYELYIFDKNGKLMLSNQLDINKIANSNNIKEFIKSKVEKSLSLAIDGEAFNLYKQYNPLSGLSFMLAIPESNITQPIQSFYSTLHIMTILTCIFFLLMFVSVVYINYRPMMLLIKKIKSSAEDYKNEGEISLIKSILDKKSHENETLTNKLSENKLMLMDFILKNLIEGISVTKNEITKTGLALQGPYFCIILASGTILKNTSYTNASTKIYKDCGYHAGITHSFFENYIVFVCDLANDGIDAREKLVKSISKILSNILPDAELKLGVGSCETGLESVRSSYLYALEAIEHEDKNKVIYYENIINSFKCFKEYPSEEVLHFIHSVKQGQTDAAIQEFHTVIEYVSKNTSHISEQYLCFDIIIIFIKTAVNLGILLSDHDIGNILKYKNVKGLQKQMIKLIEQVCQEVSYQKMTAGKRLIENIKQFIEKNFNDPDLCLVMVADNFNISIYTLSNMFNKFTGVGFRKYIANKRIEEGKKLLLSTNRSIKQITYDIGFSDVSYFIKVFKKSYGVTPKKYRQS